MIAQPGLIPVSEANKDEYQIWLYAVRCSAHIKVKGFDKIPSIWLQDLFNRGYKPDAVVEFVAAGKDRVEILSIEF